MKRLLPLGSIIMTNLETSEKLMIIGRLVKKDDTESEIFDYCACKSPFGISEKGVEFFNHDQVKRLIFIGFQDEEELQYSVALRSLDKENLKEE